MYITKELYSFSLPKRNQQLGYFLKKYVAFLEHLN